MAKAESRRKRVEVAVQEAREDMRDYLDRVEFRGERIVVTRYGRPAAALVSMADLEKIEGVA